MKKLFSILIVIFSVSNAFAQNDNKNYYYYHNEKKYLEQNSDYVFVSFTGSDAMQINELRKLGLTKYQKESISSKLKQKFNEIDDSYWAEIKLGENISIESYTQKISELKKVENIKIVSPYFKSVNSKKIGLSNFFYVKIKNLSDTLLLQQYAKRHNAVIAKQDVFMPLWFALSCTKNTGMNAMELANKFYECGMFQYAEPDLMLDDILNSVDDAYFINQWGLRNTGQYQGTSGVDIKALDAWNLSTGAGIKVAVVDQGIQLDHPDLQVNIHSLSYDTENGSTPSVVRGDHATACAGIIGAVGNTSGIRGVAPNCKLLSVSNSLVSTTLSRMKRGEGINWAVQNGADIISNSWGSSEQLQIIDDAITNALTNGRNGLGCVVIFASGNDNGQVNYPANSNPNILTVGAISPCGQRKSPSSCDGENWGSNYGPTLDVVAPGVLISTTDMTGNSGINPSLPIHTGNGGNKVTSDYDNMDYTVWFNGTSAACPHVAGVAALILSVNPSLTGQQVRDIIEQTAQKVGGYTYSITSGRHNGIWHEQMGYGLVNAYDAVKVALSNNISITGSDVACSSGATYTVNGLPTGSTSTWNKSPNLNFVGSNTGSNVTVQSAITGSDWGWVEATVSYNGQPFNVVRKTIWIGKPSTPTFISGLPAFGLSFSGGSEESFDVLYLAYQGVTSYEWMGSNATICEGQGTERVTMLLPVANPSKRISFLVKVRVGNSCGFSPYLGRLGYVGGSGGMYIAYPNPSAGEVTIEPKKNIPQNELERNGKERDARIKSIRIFDKMGNFKKQYNFAGEASVKLNLSDLPMDYYIILVNEVEKYIILKR